MDQVSLFYFTHAFERWFALGGHGRFAVSVV